MREGTSHPAPFHSVRKVSERYSLCSSVFQNFECNYSFCFTCMQRSLGVGGAKLEGAEERRPHRGGTGQGPGGWIWELVLPLNGCMPLDKSLSLLGLSFLNCIARAGLGGSRLLWVCSLSLARVLLFDWAFVKISSKAWICKSGKFLQ